MKKGDSFYWSAPWLALRRQALHRDRYRCVVCGRSVAEPGAARVDHIKTRKQHPELELVLSNLRSLCCLHDNQSHREKRTGAEQRDERFVLSGCDVEGNPLDIKHPWNKS